MAAQPQTLIYGVDDTPPPLVTLAMAVQHLALVSIFLIVAVTLARAANLPPDIADGFVALTMVAGGVGSILQSLRRGGIGSGFLIPTTTTTILLPPAMAALPHGGLPLALGMTAVAGLLVMGLSRIVHRIRPLLPPEIAGFVVLMVGLSVMILATRNVLGVDLPAEDRGPGLVVAAIALAAMVSLSVWGATPLRLYCSLIGVVVGYAAASLAGMVSHDDVARIVDAPSFRLPPVGSMGLAFDAALLVPFVIAALAMTLNTVGAVTAAQKVNDPDWKRPDFTSIGRGVLAEGITNALSALIGGMGQSSTSSAVGLSAATGAASRVIGFAIGGLLIALAFLPKVTAVLLVMPVPVVGAALLFSGCLLVVNGIQMIASRLIDSRKAFVLGIGLAFGLARNVFPDAFADVPDWLAPWVSSPMALAVSLAVLLNLIFRIGIWRKNRLLVETAHADMTEVGDFMARQGAAWGARPEVVARATIATCEVVETLIANDLVYDTVRLGRHFPDVKVPDGLISIATRFDEFRFIVSIRYAGSLLEPRNDRPSQDEILEHPAGALELARYLLRRAADDVRTHKEGDLCTVSLVMKD
ncbi:uracil-xanthine permease family protein [Azospirillum halopraeferens]|uniref:uracil-xanthine permease family protein n=1 Tax=Azospirillum halopraeferens TaxID=34010 RepID=UPI000426CC02|nr:solute carrier family 23 protein [Azospirillum halopraeferens]